MPRATVVVADEARLCCATAEGVGMIDAATAAISIATGIGGTVRDLKVSAVTAGGDALADVVIEVEFDATRSSGRGVATDVVEATARAFINASNRANRRSARLASSG